MRIVFAGKYFLGLAIPVLLTIGAGKPLHAEDSANGIVAKQAELKENPASLVYTERIADVPAWLNDILAATERRPLR